MNDFSTPSCCTHLYIFWITPSPPRFPHLRTYVMDGLFSTKKQIGTFENCIH